MTLKPSLPRRADPRPPPRLARHPFPPALERRLDRVLDRIDKHKLDFGFHLRGQFACRVDVAAVLGGEDDPLDAGAVGREDLKRRRRRSVSIKATTAGPEETAFSPSPGCHRPE